jgi:ParB family chromosome partitioning protein
MNPHIETISIESITVGRRLRKDFGDIDALAASITDHGLLHPLIVDDDGTLIAGERRLRALKQLGFAEVPVRRWGQLDTRQRQVIELEENLQRKDLTDAERSRKLKELVEVAREVDKTEFRAESVHNPKGGRPESGGSTRRVAERIGVPDTTIRDAEKHVAAVETYPFLEEKGWKQYHAMEAAEALDKLPETERPAIVKLIDQPGIPPRDAIRTIQNVTRKPADERQRIIELSQSHDDRDRTLALTEAAALPPMPDPRLELLRQAREAITKAARLYPGDDEVPRLKALVTDINALAAQIEERKRHADRATA